MILNNIELFPIHLIYFLCIKCFDLCENFQFMASQNQFILLKHYVANFPSSTACDKRRMKFLKNVKMKFIGKVSLERA